MKKRARQVPAKFGQGVATLLHIADDGTIRELASRPNTWMYQWSSIAARLFATGDTAYLPSAAYVLFNNGTAAGSVGVPSLTRSSGTSYFQGLSGSLDFLRIPFLTPPTIAVNSAYTAYLPSNLGNQLTYFTLASGPTGVKGLSFSNAASSVVLGVAIVATPVPDDPTSDLVWAASMYTSEQQTEVPVVGNLAITYQAVFP